MRVALFHNFYRQPGGEDAVFRDECALLQARGHEVVTFTVQNDAISEEGLLERLALGWKTVWSEKSYADSKRWLQANGPDMAHFHNTFPLLSPAVYYAAHSQGIPVVQTLHNYRLICPNALLFRSGSTCEACIGKTVAFPAVTAACYRESRSATGAIAFMLAGHKLLKTWENKVDAFVALTEFGRQKFIQGGLPAELIHVKPNFVYPDPGFSRSKRNYFLFVGRLVPEKGIRTLLRAWVRLGGGIPLKIVGDGPLSSEVELACSRSSGIEYLGRKSHDDTYSLLGGARALVFPSEWYEGFPKVIVEAYARGTPVIGADVGAVTETVIKGETGLRFSPGDSSHLAELALWAWDNPSAMAAMGEEARATYCRKYTAKQNGDQLQRIYEFAAARMKVCV